MISDYCKVCANFPTCQNPKTCSCNNFLSTVPVRNSRSNSK